PFDHRRVVMRMRDRDRRDSTQLAYPLNSRVVNQRDAVPKHAPRQQASLADRKLRLRVDREDAIRQVFDSVEMPAAHVFKRGPLLAVEPDVLAEVFANGTPSGIPLMLNPARHAN